MSERRVQYTSATSQDDYLLIYLVTWKIKNASCKKKIYRLLSSNFDSVIKSSANLLVKLQNKTSCSIRSKVIKFE